MIRKITPLSNRTPLSISLHDQARNRIFKNVISSSTKGPYARQQRQQQHFSADSNNATKSRANVFRAGGACLLVLLGMTYMKQQKHQQTGEDASEEEEVAMLSAEESERVFTREEISSHKDKQTGIWITYGDDVYDVTDFVDLHPGGGDKIMLAAGGAIDPYWALYANHTSSPDTLQLLDEFRIGKIKRTAEEKAQQQKEGVDAASNPYATDPERLPVFKVNTKRPFNAETPPELLSNSFITPNEVFYVRNHLPVPKVDADAYRLEIAGEGVKEMQFTLEDLKNNFSHHTVVSTVQCAGNRRTELASVKPVKGIDWTNGAIGNAEWKGVRLRDVLKHAGLNVDEMVLGTDEKNQNLRHVQFEGLDTDPTKTPYGGSIPMDKAVDPLGDVILAFEMNGTDIPRDHGYPIRVIVPGVVGARSVKWLSKIIVSEEESKSFWQKKDYKGFSPAVDFDNVDYDTAPAIQELPVQSAICVPKNGAAVNVNMDEDHDAEDEQDASIAVKGYAWSGGGRDIIRVDVTPDNGRTWVVADLDKNFEQERNRAWAWTPFEAQVPVPKESLENKSEFRVCSRAVDSTYNVQPERPDPIWNVRGVLSNAWSCVNLHHAQGAADNGPK